eukprot:SAG31_NODE_779_length_12158_cov_8.740194_10_plen_117_part_00
MKRPTGLLILRRWLRADLFTSTSPRRRFTNRPLLQPVTAVQPLCGPAVDALICGTAAIIAGKGLYDLTHPEKVVVALPLPVSGAESAASSEQQQGEKQPLALNPLDPPSQVRQNYS